MSGLKIRKIFVYQVKLSLKAKGKTYSFPVVALFHTEQRIKGQSDINRIYKAVKNSDILSSRHTVNHGRTDEYSSVVVTDISLINDGHSSRESEADSIEEIAGMEL